MNDRDYNQGYETALGSSYDVNMQLSLESTTSKLFHVGCNILMKSTFHQVIVYSIDRCKVNMFRWKYTKRLVAGYYRTPRR